PYAAGILLLRARTGDSAQRTPRPHAPAAGPPRLPGARRRPRNGCDRHAAHPLHPADHSAAPSQRQACPARGTGEARGPDARGAPRRDAAKPLCLPFSGRTTQLRCLLTSLVISNIETVRLPPKTALSLSSALMFRRSFASWRLFLRMYAQSFFTTSVRGSGLLPTTCARSSEGVSSFMNAALGLRFAPEAFLAFFAGFLAI